MPYLAWTQRPAAPAPAPAPADDARAAVRRAMTDARATVERLQATHTDPARRAAALRSTASSYRASARTPGAAVAEVAHHWRLVAGMLDAAATSIEGGR